MTMTWHDDDDDIMREANIVGNGQFLWFLLQGDCDNDDDCEGQISVVSFQISMN